MCTDNNSDIIIYDWLSFTVRGGVTPDFVISLLGMQNVSWQLIKGARGYRQRYYFDSISIHFDGEYNMGVWCEMSGQGCRAFETYGHGDFNFLFDKIVNSDGAFNITRLDVACDDHSGMLNIDTLCQDVLHCNFVSCFKSWQVTQSNNGNTVVLGSPRSDVLIRIYDKARERGIEDGSHWIRVELQMRDDRALQYITKQYNYTAGVMFCLVLNNYVRFVIPDKNDSNKSRWKVRRYWKHFLNNIEERISIYEKPKIDYNLPRLKNYVINMAGNAIDTYLNIMGTDMFFSDLQTRETAMNPKYIDLLSKYQNNKQA